MRYMNARVGGTEIGGGGSLGGYGVEGANENGQHQVDICAERGLFLSNTFFQYKMIHRYTWARKDARDVSATMLSLPYPGFLSYFLS